MSGIDDYERYQGLVLRNIVVSAGAPVALAPFGNQGRVNAFVVNSKIGIFVKHSSKRMSPWRFTFHIDQVADLLDLQGAHRVSFVAFVCGSDGLVSVDVETVQTIVDFADTEQAWVTIRRSPRSMYDICGNREELPGKVARGCGSIISAIMSDVRRRAK
jgi:hypothetical protein